MARLIVNEGSSFTLKVDFLDKTGAPATPSSITYRVDDVTGLSESAVGVRVRADTSVATASSVEITLDSVDTAVLDASKTFETRRVTVKASYGASDTLNDQFFFYVRNLGGV